MICGDYLRPPRLNKHVTRAEQLESVFFLTETDFVFPEACLTQPSDFQPAS